MTSEKTAQLFGGWAVTERGLKMAKGHRHLVDVFIQKQSFQKQQKVLDIGCGIGDALSLIEQKTNITQSGLYGIDVAEQMVHHASRLIPEGTFRCTPAECLPFEDEYFDYIISIESLYYHENLEQGLKEAYRVLKKGGRYFCAIEFYQNNLGSRYWSQVHDIFMRNYSENQYKQEFEAVGFEVRIGRILPKNSEQLLNCFSPSPYFPTMADYQIYLQEGALAIEAKKGQ